MAVNMAESLTEFLEQDPANAHAADDRGWTMLHQQALGGTAIGVGILLQHGADPNATATDGTTPLQLARSLGWSAVIEVLRAAGAK